MEEEKYNGKAEAKKLVFMILAVILGIIILGGLAAINTRISREKEKSIETIGINRYGTIDGFKIKVLNEDTQSSISNSIGSISANGEFLILKLSIENIDSKEKNIDSNLFLVNNSGVKYGMTNENLKATSYLNEEEILTKKNENYIGIMKQIKPKATKNIYLAFDIPKNLNIAKLKLNVLNRLSFNLKG